MAEQNVSWSEKCKSIDGPYFGHGYDKKHYFSRNTVPLSTIDYAIWNSFSILCLIKYDVFPSFCDSVWVQKTY